ncbi:murein biosynthesis integral membrane protein MurJ [Candidatus Tokpelaia sp.]|uniref:murein biosynthesis integral membrane protein MurJ n=1 Tax=Candidatus Tokpelaia sp. TaxID=2233777 RepID=UPI001239A59F|nr:murein biosynthesis integral membrane protein MurJ [Candidatus Tokpelaia sp.]KAA6405709.1 murein biosynthesis integral membrane protein MurJ [Candidatus Tokpelaia sp.]
MSLMRKFATVAGGTMMSRLFGFVREMLMAAALGTGAAADAFNAAFRFPNSFRRLFAEGAFNSAFVPLFAKELEQGHNQARRFAQEVFSVLFTILTVLTIAMELCMPLLVRVIIAPGFTQDTAKFSLTVRLAVIMFPYLGCMSLAAMMAGMLNALHRYFAAAIAPVFLNIILIAVLVWGWRTGQDSLHIAPALAFGVMAAGFIQLAIVWLAVRRAGVKIRFARPHLGKNVRRLLFLALPAAITGGITQINLLINTNIASGAAGAVSSLVYADRLYQLPLGVIGIAVATVLLPELARALRAGRALEANRLQSRSVEFTLLLSLPAAAAFLVMAGPIVSLLFQHGRFDAQATAAVSAIVAVYGLGLPAFVLIKAFIPSFFAREDTRTPMIFAAIAVVVNVTLALTLFPLLSARGIAIAEITAGWVNALLLLAALLQRRHWQIERLMLKRLSLFLLAAALMALALHYACNLFAAALSTAAPYMQRAGVLAALCAGAALFYFVLVFLGDKKGLALVKKMLKR